MHNGIITKDSRRGSALVYILIAIALLAILTATFMNSSGNQTTVQNSVNISTELKSQAAMIQSAIEECVMSYPEGDSGLIGTSNVPYPINPSSTYLAAPAADDLVRDLRCPGNPGDSNAHVKLFGGSTGRFLSPPPNLFDEWEYYNGDDGVYFMAETDFTDDYIQTALQKLDKDYPECGFDVIQAGGLNVVINSEGDVCPANHSCVRVWLIAKPSAIYPAEPSCP